MLESIRDTFELPLTRQDLTELRFYRPAENSREVAYLRERRAQLGGAIPAGRRESPPISAPSIRRYAGFALEANGQEMSITVCAGILVTESSWPTRSIATVPIPNRPAPWTC